MIRKLMIVWIFLVLCLLAAGGICIATTVALIEPNPVLSFFLSALECRAGIALGVMFIFTALFSIPSILQAPGNNNMLRIMNWMLVADTTAAVVVGSIIWFFSLQQQATFAEDWAVATPELQGILQDKFQCCGYFNGTSTGLFTAPTGFCADPTIAANTTGCIVNMLVAADYTLENTFTTIYGFTAVTLTLFMATACVINERKLIVRFTRIDAKRGGSGFV